MYHSKQYLTKFNSFPIVMRMNDELFFQVSASVKDNSLMVLIDQCFATSTMALNDQYKHILINQG